MSADRNTLLAQDKKVLHPLYHPTRHNDPFVVSHAEGVYLYSVDGNRWLDGMAGLWNVNVGYGNQELIDVAYQQMQKVAYTSNFASMTNLPAIALAEKLAGFAHPNLNYTHFTSGGSESTDTAIKAAFYYWRRLGKPQKRKVISRMKGYHGITLAATSATGLPAYHAMFGPTLEGFIHIPNPNPYKYEGDRREGERVAEAAVRAFAECIEREGAETIAAVIMEPIQGAGGVIIPDDGAFYFQEIRRLCDENEILLISDEVITGFGRTGAMFALPRYGIHPDMMNFAKGVTSGYIPLGGTQLSDQIRDVIESAPPTEGWMHGFTYSGHATACAVALKNIEIIERDDLIGNAQRVGAQLLAGLQGLVEEFPILANARGMGLIAGVDVVTDRQSATWDPLMAAKLSAAAGKHGLRTRPLGATLAFSPPLILSADQAAEIIERFGNTIADTLG